MSYSTERRLSPEELKELNKMAMMQARDTETEVRVTEHNWQGLLILMENILRTQETLLTEDDLLDYLNRFISICSGHLSRMEDTEQEFLKQAGKLNEAFSSGSSKVCSAAQESVKSIGNEAWNSLRDLTTETRRNLKDMLDGMKRRLRISTIISTIWVMLLAGLCTVLHLWNGA